MQFDKLYENYLKYYLLAEHVVDQVPRKLLGMSSSVLELPDETPYGFWVDRSGNFLQVRKYGHEDGLREVLAKSIEYLAKKGIKYNPNLWYDTMYEMGWMRVVIYSPTIGFNIGETPQPTTSQMKFLNILKDMYECNRLDNRD